MTRKESIKSVFETLSRTKSVLTPFGVYLAQWTRIKIIDVGSCYAVALYKGFCHNGVDEDYCIARSFPMSYKAAYRLVCSL